MKNLRFPKLFNTPLKLVIALGLLILVVEFFIMAVIQSAIIPLNMPEVYWHIIDSVLLTLIISPALYSLIFQKLQSEERFRQINASAQDAIAIIDEQGRLTDWNPAAQRMFQYSREEALGQQMHQLLAPPRDHADAARGFAHFQKTGEGPLVGKIREVTALRKDGSEFPVEIYISALKEKGRWHAVGIMRDITERTQAQESVRVSRENLHRLLNSMAEGAYGTDTDGNCTFVNAAFLQMLGYQYEEEVLGKHIHELMHHSRADGSPYPANECKAYYAYRLNRSVNVSDEVFWRKDGIAIPVEYWSHPIVADGAVTGSIVTFIDITERKRAEAAILKLNEELEEKVVARTADMEHAMLEAKQANRAKSDFLATMSHEIRTPMNGVIGMIDVLHQSSLHGYQVEMVDLIRESAHSLLDIINDILDFSKIEADKLEIEYAPMRVDDVVGSVCSMLDSMAEKKGVELTLFVEPTIPAEILGDTLRLRQVLINLTNNAIKFSGKQLSGKVSVRALLVESTANQVTLEFRVTDNGIGMSKQTLSGLFTPFTQADISTTRRFGGTGLGLSIVHHLVELMGGEITVQSELGKGSVFSVRLPFALPPEKSGISETPSLVAGLSCLVVGGHENLADDLADYLTHGGAVVKRVTDLAAAREWMNDSPSGLYIAIIDTAGGEPPLDDLHAAARAHPEQETRFVVIGRGRRREPRLENADLVLVDGNVLTSRVLLKAVSIAAGRAQEEAELPFPGRSESAVKAPSREEARRQARLILVAEDNEINQKVILRQLALLGFAADVADNGRLALEGWRSGDYALLLSDLHMPEMDGYELTAAIRAVEGDSRHIPVIALTANALRGEAERCRKAGMDDYLSKPVRLADLQATLEKWLPAVAAKTSDVGRALPAVDKMRRAEPDLQLPVDVNVLKTLVGDDAATIAEFLHDFRISAGKIAAELRVAHTRGDTMATGAAAHKLKSSARSVGAMALGEVCAEMELAGKAGQVEKLAALLPHFEAELIAVSNYLESF